MGFGIYCGGQWEFPTTNMHREPSHQNSKNGCIMKLSIVEEIFIYNPANICFGCEFLDLSYRNIATINIIRGKIELF
jgi:hypothetical protein